MKRNAPVLNEQEQKKMTKLFWIVALLPFFLVASILLLQSEDDLPPVSMLDNPPELQASLILAKKSVKEDTVIGRFWQVNRTSVKYREISAYVTDALISTEDERFVQHSGVDFRALARSFTSLGRSGGASTIPQQLAKLLFTLQQRQREEIARASGTRLELPYVGGLLGKFRRVSEKARENIIAKRLEERFTKEEIITMYLNQFDFLYNAVGIENAARVYFNKRPKDLSKSEAATLVGLCKNPTIFNPYSYQIRNYRAKIADNKGVALSAVTKEEILAARAKDSTIAHSRRNQVLFQWLKNSEKGNEALRSKITREEYNKLIKTPIVIRYRSLDHKEGMAPYFRKELRTEVQSILLAKKADGTNFNAATDSMVEARNAPLMKEIRKDMLAGEWNPSCVRCKTEESAGLRSARQSANIKWNVIDIFRDIKCVSKDLIKQNPIVRKAIRPNLYFAKLF
jgi:penicillin-binding protein 1A